MDRHYEGGTTEAISNYRLLRYARNDGKTKYKNMNRILISFLLIFSFKLHSQQLFNSAVTPYTKGLKKVVLKDKNPETGNWRIISITYYDIKGLKTKQENYRYDSEFENGYFIFPVNFIYANNKLVREDQVEYKSIVMPNELYHFDTLQKTVFSTSYMYGKTGLLDSVKSIQESGSCTVKYIYKNNKLAQSDSICSIGCCCDGIRKQYIYNDKNQLSSVTCISGIVNNECEPSNYNAPSQFNEYFYNEKKFIKQEKVKNSSVFKGDSDPLIYNYTYTGNRLDAIELNPLNNSRVNETIQKAAYKYDSKQLLIGIDVYYTGDDNQQKFKYDFVY